MKDKQKTPSKITFYLVILFLSLVCFIVLLYPTGKHGKKAQIKEIYQQYSSTHEQIAKRLIDNLSEIIDEVGIDGVVSLIQLGQQNNTIDSSQCHALMHLLGHQAYSRALEISGYIKQFGNMCEAGFLHGVEAQITLEITDSKQRNIKLRDLCALFKANFHNSACFHGVGHAFYQMLHDPLKALKACDTLEEEGIDLNPCYRGVFNELTYDIEGVDGETGIKIAGEHKKIENITQPYLYCNNYEELYRDQCFSTIGRITNTYIPVPYFISKLSNDEQKIINVFPQVEMTTDEKKARDELVRKLAVKGDTLDLVDCKPVKPIVMKVEAGKDIFVTNSSSKIHSISLNKDTSYSVKPQETVLLDYQFDEFNGVYGYGCDYTPYAVGYFVIEASKSGSR